MQPKTPATISGLAQLLKQVGSEMSGEEIADMLWFALQIEPELIASLESKQEKETQTRVIRSSERKTLAPPPPEPVAQVYTSVPQAATSGGVDLSVLSFRAPAASALPHKLAIARALRPLMRKVRSRMLSIIDEEATAVQIVEERIWSPVMCSELERWLELTIVIEESASLPIWEETIAEFRQLMERQGAFRDVQTWYLKQDGGSLQLSAGKRGNDRRGRSPRELLDPAQRRLILLVSDCVSPAWRSGLIKPLLDQWAQKGSVTVLQLFPEPLWERSALGGGIAVGLSSEMPGLSNLELTEDELPEWLEVDEKTKLKLPIVTLEPNSLQKWAKVVAGVRKARTSGIVFDNRLMPLTLLDEKNNESEENQELPFSAEELVNRFWATASPGAKRLAGLMAATQVTLPIVHLIQRELMPNEASPVQVAEVFMSGLLYRLPPIAQVSRQVLPRLGRDYAALADSPIVGYDFFEGVRDSLIDATPRSDTEAVLEEIILRRLSKFIEERKGVAIRSFEAFLRSESTWDESIQQEIAPFAQITRQVLRRWGGEYAVLADRLGQEPVAPPGREFIAFPPLQEFKFETAQIEETETLQPFDYETANVKIQRKGIRRQPQVVIAKEQRQTWGYTEPLSETIALEMVEIPAGSFLMGSPENEPERRDSESPQHEVTVSTFFMGGYPVTQAQWRVVAALPQIERSLEPEPSSLKGADKPVERVSWLEAKEFCARLSQLSQKQYRLPTEAEWEYACRAGTTTPFYFGETITPDLVNYDWTESYNKIKVTKKKDFEGTTSAGSFPANGFGLYDMHGNVWEWCEDRWYSDYEGAPTDGTAWLDLEANSEENEEEIAYILRGGSWDSIPRNCRSAARVGNDAGTRDNDIGFRVVCAASRTL